MARRRGTGGARRGHPEHCENSERGAATPPLEIGTARRREVAIIGWMGSVGPRPRMLAWSLHAVFRSCISGAQCCELPSAVLVVRVSRLNQHVLDMYTETCHGFAGWTMSSTYLSRIMYPTFYEVFDSSRVLGL
jgi:hypothetical protein